MGQADAQSRISYQVSIYLQNTEMEIENEETYADERPEQDIQA